MSDKTIKSGQVWNGDAACGEVVEIDKEMYENFAGKPTLRTNGDVGQMGTE